VFLVLPGIAQRGKPCLKRAEAILQIAIEALQFLGAADSGEAQRAASG
jgi:hypothetical protein